MNLIKLVALLSTGFGIALVVIFTLMCLFHGISFIMQALAFIFWIVVIFCTIGSFLAMFR